MQNQGESLPNYFSRGTSAALKAIAIFLLLTGHYFLFCVEGYTAFNIAGETAVMIFLLVSAMGLTKSYGLVACGKTFIKKRLVKIFFPLWISLAIFYLLDFFLLGKNYSWYSIVVNFAGVIRKAPPNEPAWFISFILYLYMLYFLVSNLPVSVQVKCLVLLFLSYATTFSILHVPFLSWLFGGWTTFTFVFPLSVCIMIYGQFFKKYLGLFFDRSMLLLVFLWIVMAALYFIVPIFKTAFFIAFVGISIFFLDKIKSMPKILLIVSNYTFEIYLLHFPFMVKYNIISGTKPLLANVCLYLFFIVLASIGLKKASQLLIYWLSVTHLSQHRKKCNTLK